MNMKVFVVKVTKQTLLSEKTVGTFIVNAIDLETAVKYANEKLVLSDDMDLEIRQIPFVVSRDVEQESILMRID